MRRILDVACGVLIGVGIFGFYACFVEEGFDLNDKLLYVTIIALGGVMTMIDIG